MKTTTGIVTTSLALALLSGCDGATITIDIDPHTSSSSSVQTSSSSSVASSSTAIITSSSSSSVDICDSDMPPPGAPACYLITPDCAEGESCQPEFRVSDFCGVRGLNAEFVDVSGLGDCSSIELKDYNTCKDLNGMTFLTTTLEEGGLTPNGASKMHWRFTFENGQVRLLQSDFGLSGSYACRNDQVIVNLDHGPEVEHILDIDARLFQFTFDTLGTGTKTYQNTYDLLPNNFDACAKVAGNHYALINQAASPLEKNYYLIFDEAPNSVTYSDGNKVEQGNYDCDLGTLHVHTPSHDEIPLTLDVAEDASSVTIRGLNSLTLPLENPTPGFCTKEYAPVCGTQQVQCVTAPCPPLHKTYGNRCEAESNNESILFEGECGKLEGAPVASLPVICPAVFDPVCAKRVNKEIACFAEPCPTHDYKTFGNNCEAAGRLAVVSFEGSCERYGLEGSVRFEQTPTRLDIKTDETLKSVTLISATIKDDVLSAKIGYSGCDIQPINFTVDTAFLESFPVQANYFFSKTVDDFCKAYFEQEYSFDLLPLQAAYKTMYNAEHGEIALRGIGSYQF